MFKDHISKLALFRFVALVSPHSKLLLFGSIALVLGSTINVLLPEAARRLLEEPLRSTLIEKPWTIAESCIALFALQSICFYLRTFLFGVVSARIVSDVRTRFFAAVINKPSTENAHSSALASHLDYNASLLGDAIATRLPLVVRYGLQAIVSIILMLTLSTKLSLVAGTSALLLVLIAVLLLKTVRMLSRTEQSKRSHLVGWAAEVFSGATFLRLLGAENEIVKEFKSRVQELLNLSLTRTRCSALSATLITFLNSACIVIGLSYGVTLVSAGELKWSELTAFALYATILTISFGMFASGYAELVSCSGSVDTLLRCIDAYIDIPLERQTSQRIVPNTSGLKIEARSISFTYPSRSESQLIIDSSFIIQPGSTTALQGASGVGKSTLIRILLRICSPTNGELLFDNQPYPSIDPEIFNASIAWIPQETSIFGISLFENLRLANSETSLSKATEVLEAVGLHELVRNLPHGIHTEVGERGTELSGGQRQRLALARVLLREPRLLIFDEATSALDEQAELELQTVMRKAFPLATFLVVSHRTTTLRDVDARLLVEHGKINQII